MSNPSAFNPLDKQNLGESVALALSRCPLVSLTDLPSFKGAGIYALYYTGDFPPYAPLAAATKRGANIPIYVGKAVPEGSRKGVSPQTSQKSAKLRDRLNKHARSISQTKTLKVSDFSCRYLVVDETWIGLCESLLIQISTPLWNAKLDGFGRNPQGKNRKDGVSPWHAFHSGRDVDPGGKVSATLLTELSTEVEAFMIDLLARIGKTP